MDRSILSVFFIFSGHFSFSSPFCSYPFGFPYLLCPEILFWRNADGFSFLFILSIVIGEISNMAKRFSVIFPCFAPALLLLLIINCTAAAAETVTCSGIVPMTYRNDKISITDFGGVGDGRTLNTKAFREAIYRIGHLKRRGGTLLYIPPGVYLTESFNLTSHMTLYLARDAVIKATTVKFVLFFLLHS